MFYNGFNLLIDILVAWTVWYFVRRHYKDYEYAKGMLEALEAIDSGDLKKEGDTWVIPCADGTFIDLCTNKSNASL